MTGQEIFDKVAKHLLTQNAQSMGIMGCAYRGDNGLQCAVGCLIPDELYRPEFEGKTAHFLGRGLQDTLWGLENQGLVEALQHVHDRRPVSAWKDGLCNVAYSNGLATDVLDAFLDAEVCQ